MLNKQMLLARIAEREGHLGTDQGSNRENHLQIDRFISVIYALLHQNHLEHPKTIFPKIEKLSWDCIFAYYCCYEAGYRIPINILENNDSLLQSPLLWKSWAEDVNQLLWYPFGENNFNPIPGDLILFGSIPAEGLKDHIGIVTAYSPGNVFITTAEGTVDRTVSIFIRQYNQTIRGFIRLESDTNT